MSSCIFCNKHSGELIIDPFSESSFHTACLSDEQHEGNTLARKIAFYLGCTKDYQSSSSKKMITRAMLIYYDSNLSLDEAMDLNMLGRFDLVHGEYYIGYCKRSNVGVWNDSTQCFHLYDKTLFKADYFYKEYNEDKFIPIF